MWIGNSGRAACAAAAAAALLAVAGCESATEPLDGVAVADVQVRRSATVAATALPSGLRESMLAIVPGCAGGGGPHDALVEVLAVRRDRDAGSQRRQGVTLTAEVTFVARGSERRTGPWRVSVSTVGTSLPGAPSGNPESVLSNLFAAAVCREVFGAEHALGG
ncbi:MAG: hypothetical protein RIC82_05845 [Parvibaculum sp.]